jgi:hypothetical protein
MAKGPPRRHVQLARPAVHRPAQIKIEAPTSQSIILLLGRWSEPFPGAYASLASHFKGLVVDQALARVQWVWLALASLDKQVSVWS